MSNGLRMGKYTASVFPLLSYHGKGQVSLILELVHFSLELVRFSRLE